MLLGVLLAIACTTKPYVFRKIDAVGFTSRAQTQMERGVRVRVAVPSEDEAEAIFGVRTYDRGVQPVWIEIENGTDQRLRYAPVGTDPDYFSPLEVPYMLRKGFSKEARAEMDARFYRLAMPRIIGAGRSSSGFVFTNTSPGTKTVGIDLFGATTDRSFIFFVDVPGRLPDHANVDFEALYSDDELRSYAQSDLREALAALPCCTSNRTGGGMGLPYNIVLIARGSDVLHALLRAGWYETKRPRGEVALDRAPRYFGRVPDAIFRRLRSGPGGAAGESDRNELRLWLAPMEMDGEEVWMAQLKHYIGRATQIEQLFIGSRLDPDIDEGRDYMLQLAWYAQSLRKFAWLGGGVVATVDDPRRDSLGAQYFTGGHRVVLWLSGDPISVLEIGYVEWDEVPDE
jgi:hypothetical protein